MKQLKLWRDEVTEASLEGKTPHDFGVQLVVFQMQSFWNWPKELEPL